MASKLIWPQMAMARRQMSSLVASRKSPPQDLVQTSTLASGLKITSVDSEASADSTVSILVKAGPAYETYDNLGLSHALRANVGMATKSASGFILERYAEQMGATIHVSGSREYTVYTLSAARDKIVDAFDYFGEVVTSPCFRWWEQRDHVHEKMTKELAATKLNDMTLALESLHKAAFRHGLGNSLYAPKYMIGKHGSDALADFHGKTHTVNRATVCAHGIDHFNLTRMSQNLHLETGHGPTSASQYFGGESRQDLGPKVNVTTIAIAGESVGASNAKEAIAFEILTKVLGVGTRLNKRGPMSGKLGRALAKIDGPKAVAGLNLSYQDTGLTGAVITSDASIAGSVLSEVVGVLKGLSVTEEDVVAAKKALQMDQAEMRPEAMLETLGRNALMAHEAVDDLVHLISASDVNAAAKKLGNAKLSMSAVGNLKNVPYLDSL